MPLADITDALRALASKRVMVGVPSDAEPHESVGQQGSNARRPADGKASSINNATLAYIHTNGAPEVNIPARPFLGPGVTGNKDKIADRLQAAGKAALAGNGSAVDRYLNAIGIETVSAARAVIQEGIPPPLKPATIAARRQRSKGSSYRRKATAAGDVTPLLDTGQLVAAISYAIRTEKD